VRAQRRPPGVTQGTPAGRVRGCTSSPATAGGSIGNGGAARAASMAGFNPADDTSRRRILAPCAPYRSRNRHRHDWTGTRAGWRSAQREIAPAQLAVDGRHSSHVLRARRGMNLRPHRRRCRQCDARAGERQRATDSARTGCSVPLSRSELAIDRQRIVGRAASGTDVQPSCSHSVARTRGPAARARRWAGAARARRRRLSWPRPGAGRCAEPGPSGRSDPERCAARAGGWPRRAGAALSLGCGDGPRLGAFGRACLGRVADVAVPARVGTLICR
jgi:hypothetical protein